LHHQAGNIARSNAFGGDTKCNGATSLIYRCSQEKGGREMHPNEGKQQALPPNPVEPVILHRLTGNFTSLA
jgi:hypothetical protein